MKNEITVKEIEDGLFVASYNGEEVSHGRTVYQAIERAKEFLKKSLQAV
jgi:hypothetical protein